MAKMAHRPPTVHELQKMGYPLVPGRDYIPKEWVPKKTVSLERVRRRLAKIKGSLAATVAALREQEG